jgi:hypothetical protein
MLPQADYPRWRRNNNLLVDIACRVRDGKPNTLISGTFWVSTGSIIARLDFSSILLAAFATENLTR